MNIQKGNIRLTQIVLWVTFHLVSIGWVRAQNPDLPPSGNFDLTEWKITLPDQSEIKENELSIGFERANEFYTDPSTGAMVFVCPNDGATGGSSYPRSELREMLRAGNTSISTTGIGLNNWVFSSSSEANRLASGGVNGVLRATVAVDHVSTTGESSKVGRVIIGQIHASSDEPCRLYYRKLPGNTKGAIYFAHEPTTSSEQWYEMIGTRSSSASNPVDGIALGEKFSYEIRVVGDELTVTIMRPDKPDVQQVVDMSASGFADDWMYFKAGVYNQNNTGDDGDYCQVSFYALSKSHSDANNEAPTVNITSPESDATFTSDESITITADADDSDGTVSKVEFYYGTTKIGEDISDPFEYVWTGAPAGSHVITAKATDNEGVSATSFGVSINVTGVYTIPYDIPRFQAYMDECKLQAPTSTTAATTSELQNGYVSEWFYVAEGDKLAFNQSGESNRTEFRFLDNWIVTERDRSFHGRLKFVEQTCDEVTVVQIHDDAGAGDGPNKPLLRIYKDLVKSPVNHLWAAIKTDIAGISTDHVDLGLAPDGYFDWSVSIEDGFMIIHIADEEKVNKDVSFWTFPSYWKNGVYLQAEGEATVYFDELFLGNTSPILNITSPANGTIYDEGDIVLIKAGAADSDGFVDQIEFFANGISIGADNSIPYSVEWAIGGGSFDLTAVATDDDMGTTTSSPVTVIGEMNLLRVDDLLDEIIIYPIPSTSTITIDVGLEFLNGTLTLFDTAGRAFQKVRITKENEELQLPKKAGLYLIKIEKGDRSSTLKVVKQ